MTVRVVLAPNTLRSLHDQPELSLLICRGEGVSNHGAGKAALRAYRQMLKGHEAARFADTAFELVDRLEVPLGCLAMVPFPD